MYLYGYRNMLVYIPNILRYTYWSDADQYITAIPEMYINISSTTEGIFKMSIQGFLL